MMPVAAHARNSSGSFPRLSEKDSFKEMLDGGVIGIFVLPWIDQEFQQRLCKP